MRSASCLSRTAPASGVQPRSWALGQTITGITAGRVVADTERSLVLYASGFAPRWYVPRIHVGESALASVEGQTFRPSRGLASYHDIDGAPRAAWSYEDAWPEVGQVSGVVSFEADPVEVYLDGVRIRLEPGRSVVSHGVDRNLDLDEAVPYR
ncbi:DUF427 domain-containing protein [Streptomyces albogriseolus]|uniref:DUF427 domain-containing protein n=1 Tax=Streptomyces albogriseolus TaxID=1887 RepID=UPI0033B07F93